MLNRYQKSIPTTTSTSGHPRGLDWIIAIFLVIIQQNAFVDIAYDLLSPMERTRGTENGFNTVSIAISILFVCIGSIGIFSRIRSLALRNLVFNTIYCDRANLSHLVSASRFELTEGVRICSDNRHCRLYCRAVHNGASPIGARKEFCNMRGLFCNIRITVSRDGHYEWWGIGRKLEGYLSS